MSRTSIVHNGVTYASIHDACRAIGLNYKAYSARRARGFTLEQSLVKTLPRKKMKYPNRIGHPQIVFGVLYPSITAVAHAFNILPVTLDMRMRKGKMTCEQAVMFRSDS